MNFLFIQRWVGLKAVIAINFANKKGRIFFINEFCQLMRWKTTRCHKMFLIWNFGGFKLIEYSFELNKLIYLFLILLHWNWNLFNPKLHLDNSRDFPIDNVPWLNRSNSCRCPGENQIPGLQLEVFRDVTDEVGNIEDHVLGISILPLLIVDWAQ